MAHGGVGKAVAWETTIGACGVCEELIYETGYVATIYSMYAERHGAYTFHPIFFCVRGDFCLAYGHKVIHVCMPVCPAGIGCCWR
jgi:hypothetical protein